MDLNFLQALTSFVTWLVNSFQAPSDLISPLQLHSGDKYDFIIVGAGSAGCVVANRLSEISDWSILLLESGEEEKPVADVPWFWSFLSDTNLNWGYMSVPGGVPCGGNPCPVVRGKGLGGSSAINALFYVRGNKFDYDHWEKLGNVGWDFGTVLQYFKKSENNLDPDINNDTEYHSIGGPQDVERQPYQDENTNLFAQALEEIGMKKTDYNGERQEGFMISQQTLRNGERVSTNRAFLKPVIRRRKNLRVVTNVRVTKVVFDSKTKKATGIEYAWEKDRKITGKIFASKEVILSAGAVNSPQLLMLSGIGPKEVLQPLKIPVIKDLDVGKNLQDHATIPGIRFTSGKYQPLKMSEILRDANNYYKPKRGGYWSSTGINQLSFFAKTKYADKSIDYPDLQIFFIPSSSWSKTEMNEVMFLPAILRPQSRGNISITSTDPFVQPAIFPNYLSEDQDVKVLIDSFNIARKLGETRALKQAGFVFNTTYMPSEEDFKNKNFSYWKDPNNAKFFSMFHTSGTCKMGASSDSASVVDSSLKVHGFDNLRVIDASIMPNIASGNINAPTIMIAEKGSDMIKNDWKKAISKLKQ